MLSISNTAWPGCARSVSRVPTAMALTQAEHVREFTGGAGQPCACHLSVSLCLSLSLSLTSALSVSPRPPTAAVTFPSIWLTRCARATQDAGHAAAHVARGGPLHHQDDHRRDARAVGDAAHLRGVRRGDGRDHRDCEEAAEGGLQQRRAGPDRSGGRSGRRSRRCGVLHAELRREEGHQYVSDLRRGARGEHGEAEP